MEPSYTSITIVYFPICLKQQLEKPEACYEILGYFEKITNLENLEFLNRLEILGLT
jgi:hypothetical protein